MIGRRSATSTLLLAYVSGGGLITLAWPERGPGGMANLTRAGPAQHSCFTGQAAQSGRSRQKFSAPVFLWLLGATVLVYLTCVGIILGMENGARFMKKKTRMVIL